MATWLALLGASAAALRRQTEAQGLPERREWSRKLVHIGTGAVVLIAWLFAIDRRIALGAAAATTLLAALNHRFHLLPGVEDVGRTSYGTVAYGASITVLFWQYWPQAPASVAAGVLVMAVGDGLAGLLGSALPSPSWQVLGQRRSVLGTVVMALASLAVLSCLKLAAGGPTWWALLLLTAMAVLFEQIAIRGFDNLSVPLGVAGLWNSLS